MKRHLPRGKWSREAFEAMSWKQLVEVARYPYGGSKKRAKRRIHKMERQAAKRVSDL